MSLTRIRRQKNSGYTIIANEILMERNISLKAKGLFTTVMGLPDTWNFSVEGITAVLKEGDTAIRAAIHELIEGGYCHYERERRPDGTWGEAEYVFIETPRKPQAESPNLENPNQVNSDQENRPLYNKQGIKETKDIYFPEADPDPAVEEEPVPINPPTAKVGPAAKDPTAEIFDYWVEKMGKTSTAKLTSDRKAKIRARLKEGYTVADIKQAIDGCSASPFHMGDNPNGKTYNDLELICRNGSKLEGFMEITSGPAKRPDGDLGISPPFAKTTWSDLQEIMSIEAENDEASAAAYADHSAYRRAADGYAAKGHIEQGEVRDYERSEAYAQRFGNVVGTF